MSGLIRRLVILATIEGLVLQPHSVSENQSAVQVSYKSSQITAQSKGAPKAGHDSQRLEAFGLIGLLEIANSSYLIAITKRKEVARIFDKPIFLVTDVALLPLSSQSDASAAIKAVSETSEGGDASESDLSDSDDDHNAKKAADIASTPGDDIRPFSDRNASNTSVAEEVARGTVTFGRFASQWFSRRKSTTAETSSKDDRSEPRPAEEGDQVVEDIKAANQKRDAASQQQSGTTSEQAQSIATINLTPRILRTTKMLFTSGSYFYSHDIDLTRSFKDTKQIVCVPELPSLNQKYVWNRQLGSKFIDSGHIQFVTPILQGFVGQRAFELSKASGNEQTKASEVSPADAVKDGKATDSPATQSFLLTLISRRSTKRSGLRYLRRGIDDEGNVANFAETEQILSAADWNPSTPITSFLQIRGSIPLYFAQSPYQFKPTVVFHNSQEVNEKAFVKHFRSLKQDYGSVQIAMLVDRSGNEKPVGEAYEKLYHTNTDNQKIDKVYFEWFDFHSECRGMKFENVSKLIDTVSSSLDFGNLTVIKAGQILQKQKGVIRTNCMDCLDRTNVAQSAFGQFVLQNILQSEGFKIDFVEDPSTNWFNTLWADNGDAISRQYAGTAALKGDFTRTRKRDWRGAMNDFGLTLTRYYSNMVNDYFSQAVIDVLVGNVSWKVFEDFETKMMSVDPGISVKSGREAAIDTCTKIVIADPSKEDLVHAWTMLVPNQDNSLRTIPFEEAVVLLTDVAVYCCRMDWSTEKVARYEKVDLRNIKSVKWGVYITSTFTDRQLQEESNQGLVIYYAPGSGDIVRVNTRSLQNSHIPDDARQGYDGGTGIMSWVASSVKPATPDRVMALKVVYSDDDLVSTSKSGSPSQIAETVADEIRRAIVGKADDATTQQAGKLIEHAEIISVAEAKKRTGYLEQVSHSLKKLVWA